MYEYSVESMSGLKASSVRTIVVFQKGRVRASYLLNTVYGSVIAAAEYGENVITNVTDANQRVLQVSGFFELAGLIVVREIISGGTVVACCFWIVAFNRYGNARQILKNWLRL